MTLGTIKTEVARRMDDTANTRYSADRIVSVVNQGQRIFAFLTLAIERSVNLALAANTVWYSVLGTAADWIAPLRVENSSSQRVRPATIAQLDALNPLWRAATAAAGPTRYGLTGTDLLFVHPAPSGAGVTLPLKYAAMPAALSIDAHVPEIRAQYHKSLCDYAVFALKLPEGGQELPEALENWRRFQEAVVTENQFCRDRAQQARYDTIPPELEPIDVRKLIQEAQRGSDANAR